MYLDLEVEEPWWGGDYELSIENRSDRTLHNATLVLCLHCRDVRPDDCVAIPDLSVATTPCPLRSTKAPVASLPDQMLPNTTLGSGDPTSSSLGPRCSS